MCLCKKIDKYHVWKFSISSTYKQYYWRDDEYDQNHGYGDDNDDDDMMMIVMMMMLAMMTMMTMMMTMMTMTGMMMLIMMMLMWQTYNGQKQLILSLRTVDKQLTAGPYP